MDKHELDLEYKIIDLKDCQKSKGYYTCSDCKEFINCSLRKEYVSKVYSSMSKDKEGDFNFD